MEINTKVPILNPTQKLNNIFINRNIAFSVLIIKSDKYYCSKFYDSEKFLKIRQEKFSKFEKNDIYNFICENKESSSLFPILEEDEVTLISKDKTINVESETKLGKVDVNSLCKTFETFGLYRKFEKNKLSIMIELSTEPFNVEFVYSYVNKWSDGKWYCEIETTDDLQQKCSTTEWSIEEYESRISDLLNLIGLNINDSVLTVVRKRF